MSEAIATLAAVAMAAVGVTNRSNRKRVTVQASTHDVFIAMVIVVVGAVLLWLPARAQDIGGAKSSSLYPVSYTHLRAHETVLDLVCRLLLEKKNKSNTPRSF